VEENVPFKRSFSKMGWPRHIQVGTYILVDGYTFKLINLFLGEKKSELTYVKKSLNKGDKDL